MPELLPCPFCGAPGQVLGEPPSVRVECVDHYCAGASATDAEAIAAWNRRSPAPAHGELRERIEAEISAKGYFLPASTIALLESAGATLALATPAASAVVKCSSCGRWMPAAAGTCWGCEFDVANAHIIEAQEQLARLGVECGVDGGLRVGIERLADKSASAVDVEAIKAAVRAAISDDAGEAHAECADAALDAYFARLAASAGKETT